MKSETIIGRMPEGIQLAQELAETLQHSLPSKEHGEVPDVLHILGGWTPKARSRARWAQKHFIPVMHTPLGMLASWERPSSTDIRLSEQAERLVATGAMEYELLDGDKNGNTILILNSLVTTSISREEMKSLFESHLVQMVQETDRKLREKAAHNVELLKEDNPQIQEILRQLFYMKDLDTRGLIPEATMKKFADTLINSDFNEDHFAQVVSLIHLDKFMANLEKQLFDKELLTEGFMPIPMKF